MYTLLSVTLICCFSLQVTNGQFIRTPRNVATKVGHNVSLSCAAIGQYSWLEYITNSLSSQAITFMNTVVLNKTKFHLNIDTSGNYELIIMSVELKDGGKYRCKNTADANQYRDAEIIVLDGDPVCSTNVTNNEAVEEDSIVYNCEVKYQGRWAPVMEWKNKVGVIRANNETTNNKVKYTYVHGMTPADNGQVFSCRTYFDQPKPGTEAAKVADNMPSTESWLTVHTWPEITVYYGPHTLTVHPAQDSYSPGVELKIAAESNPSKQTYKWVNTTTSETVGTEETFAITDDLIGNQQLKVIVCNTIAPTQSPRTICKDLQLNFTVTSDSTGDSAVDSAEAVAIFGVLGVLLCVATAIIV